MRKRLLSTRWPVGDGADASNRPATSPAEQLRKQRQEWGKEWGGYNSLYAKQKREREG